MMLSMQLSSLPFLVVFSIVSTIASPVGESSNQGPNDAENPFDLGTPDESTEQPFLNTINSQSTSQLLATNPNPVTPVLGPTESSWETPQQLTDGSFSVSSADLGTSKSVLDSGPSRQLGAGFQSQPISPSERLNPEKVADIPGLPECEESALAPVCCFGKPRADFFGNYYINDCQWCKNPTSFFPSLFLEIRSM